MTKFFRVSLLILVALMLVSGGVSAQESRQVYAFYFGWWLGDSWNDPALPDRPASPYDQRDPNVIGSHIDQARGAGIDAFIMSYYGPADNNLTAQTFNALLDQAAARGFRAGAAVDLGGAYNATTDAVTQTLSYLINDRAAHPGYLRFNGMPVIYFWNQARFSVDQWAAIRQQVDPNHSTIWVAEGTNTNFLSVFDGLYLFNVAWSGNPASTAATWMQRTVQAGGWFYTPTVHPGWDESAIAAREGRTNPTDPQSRNGGGFLTQSWNGAASSGASIILIVSWNEYYESSHIEPSQNHGTTALDTLRPLISAWKGGAPAAAAPAASGAAAGAPTGQTFTLGFIANFRAEPNTGSGVIALIPFQTVVDIVGRNADASWLQVNFNGSSGWVSASLGTPSGDVNALPVTG